MKTTLVSLVLLVVLFSLTLTTCNHEFSELDDFCDIKMQDHIYYVRSQYDDQIMCCKNQGWKPETCEIFKLSEGVE